MKIELNHEEIEAALKAYVGQQGINIDNKAISVDMTAGRGEKGYTASITIEPMTSTKEPGPASAALADVPTIEKKEKASKAKEEPVAAEPSKKDDKAEGNKSLFGGANGAAN